MIEQMKVIKRDGKKVEFDGTKIALAIKKGFDSVIWEESPRYTTNDVNKVYNHVIQKIEQLGRDRIKIEEIQDLIEEQLKLEGYQDVYESFSEYRERRAQSRKIFFDEKKQHKFLKALEDLSLKSVQEDKKTDSPIEMMLDYGSTVSKEFAKSYLMKKKFAEAHDSGDIFIHDLNFIPIGTTTCCQIDLNKLYEDGFRAGNITIREPKDIMSYSALAVIAINQNQKEQHGCQSIPAFDYYMAKGVIQTFKKQFKQTIEDILEFTDFDKFAAVNGIEREIERIETIQFDIHVFDKYCRESEQLKRMFAIAYEKTLQKVQKLTYQAMEAFIHDVNVLNTKNNKENTYPTINFGTDFSPEGRMVSKTLLQVIAKGLGNNESSKSPVLVFKIKEGINFKKEDINYDLFQSAMQLVLQKHTIHFSFLDAPFNIEKYKEGDIQTEVAYNTRNMRVFDNDLDKNKEVVTGRGNISYTTINLPRLGIKHGKVQGNANVPGFFQELEEKMELVKDQLLERFEVQGSKKASCFNFLIQEGVWIDGEKLREDDKIRKVLKHGSLSIGFIGLAECLKALTGSRQEENRQAQHLGIEIIQFMKKKCDEYSEKYGLNFSLIGTQEEKACRKLINIDRAIYGKINGVTTGEKYTNSFYVAEESKKKIKEKIQLEAPYHAYTNGGHVCVISLEKEITIEKLEEMMQYMRVQGIGYAEIHKDK